MSSIGSVSNSLLENILLNNQQSDSDQATNVLTSISQTADSQTQTSGSNPTDTVSLTNNIQVMVKEALLQAESNFLSGSGNSSSDILGGNQGSDSSNGPLYDLFVSEENAHLMEANPSLVKNIISAQQAQTAGSSSSSSSTTQSQASGSEILQAIQNLNLLTITPESLMALQKYTGSSTSGTTAASGSQVDKTA